MSQSRTRWFFKGEEQHECGSGGERGERAAEDVMCKLRIGGKKRGGRGGREGRGGPAVWRWRWKEEHKELGKEGCVCWNLKAPRVQRYLEEERGIRSMRRKR